jgi:hypothetical protein
MKEKIEKAIFLFGKEVVSEVIELVSVSDPDGAWSLFSDMNLPTHQECVEYLYF